MFTDIPEFLVVVGVLLFAAGTFLHRRFRTEPDSLGLIIISRILQGIGLLIVAFVGIIGLSVLFGYP